MKKLILTVALTLAAVSVHAATAPGTNVHQASMALTAAKAAYKQAHDDLKTAQTQNGINASPGYQNAAKAAWNANMGVVVAQHNLAIAQLNAKAVPAGTTPTAVPNSAAAAAAKAAATPTASTPMTALTPSQPAQTTTINKPAGSLPANTPVQTPQGVVPAGSLPPQTQVAVPHIPAIINSPILKGGQQGHSGHSNGAAHDGRGQDNAHSHAFGGHGYGADNSKSEGFGGHSHFH